MVIVSNKKTYSIINEAAHRKRARYQNGLESNSYLGENVVSPQYTLANSVTPIFAKTYPRVIQQIERQTD